MFRTLSTYSAHSIATAQINVPVIFVIIPFFLLTVALVRLNVQLSNISSSSGHPISLLPTTQSLSQPSTPSLMTPISVQSESDNETQDESDIQRLVSQVPDCAHKGQAATFLMVFQGHSGSTAIMTALMQHSQTNITGLEPVDHPPFTLSSGGTSATLTKRAAEHVQSIFATSATSSLATGFKIRPTHILKDPSLFKSIVQRYETRIIWSYRSNIFKQAIGDYRIHEYGDLKSYEGLKVLKDGSVESISERPTSFAVTKMDAFRQMVRNRANADKTVMSAVKAIMHDGCVLPISYEGFLKTPELTLKQISAFLGLNVTESISPLRAKANQDSLCDLISNYEDVCKEFFGCSELRWMLDDTEHGCSCRSVALSSLASSRQHCSMFTYD